MRKCALALLLFLSAATAADGRANVQSPANFSGHWVLASVNPERPAYDQFWLGTETTVTQDGTSLVVSRLSPAPRREARFTLDRKESRNEYVVNGQKVIRESRATLNGGTLLISTDTTIAEGQRYLSNILRWSLDANGLLLVADTEICGKGECPSVITTLRFKKKD